MEIACKVFYGFLALFTFALIAGSIDTWWEERKREQEVKRRHGRKWDGQ